MKRVIHYLIISSAFLIISSCGYEDLPPQTVIKTPAPRTDTAAQVEEKKTVAGRNVYKGDKFRDPFIPLTGEGYTALTLSEEVTVPNIGGLALKGIFDDGSLKMALISGGGINYVLKGSKLYDNRQRLVKGISGIIRKDSVLMIAPDKSTKELKLKNK